jgi:hypothetical protein
MLVIQAFDVEAYAAVQSDTIPCVIARLQAERHPAAELQRVG